MLWIGSYPKSGSTWVQHIVAYLLYGQTDPVRIRQLIPNSFKANPGDGVFKTHMRCAPENGQRIYVVRHPVDVCASSVNYRVLKTGKVSREKFVRKFIENKGNPDWIRAGYGNWSRHVINWGKQPRLLVRYEGLCKNTAYETERIALYLGINKLDVADVIRHTSFEHMKKLEDAAVEGGKSSTLHEPKWYGQSKSIRFMNRGTCGYAAEILTDAEIAGICRACRKGMDRIGYGDYERIS